MRNANTIWLTKLNQEGIIEYMKKIKLRTWNLNYWKKLIGDEAKNEAEIIEWKQNGAKILSSWVQNDSGNSEKVYSFLLLQEVSLKLYGEIIGNNLDNAKGYGDKNELKVVSDEFEINYNIIPKKLTDWGLIIDSRGSRGEKLYDNNILGVVCYKYIIEHQAIIIFNIHAQRDYDTKTYSSTWYKIINEIKEIILKNENALIILAGDFNMSDKHFSNEIESFKDVFIKIKQLKMTDCTEKIPIDDRDTMPYHSYPYQNDYIFINDKYLNNQWDIEILKDQISKNYSDHYPIDFWIKL